MAGAAADQNAAKKCLVKSSAVDIAEDEAKRLAKGISKTAENVEIILQVRNEVGASLTEVEESTVGGQPAFIETNDCTFSLPDLSSQSDEFRTFLENELIDTSMAISLQEAMRLNWWTCLGNGCEKLWPLSTTGDGNCLLHAASLGMWGFHDRLLTLRKAMHSFLTTGNSRHALWRRWRWQTARSNVQSGLGLYLSEDEWRSEWDNILKLASPLPRTSATSPPNLCDCTDAPAGTDPQQPHCHPLAASSKTYESLEEIHVLALAHVLRRPIIVLSDTVLKDVNGEALAPITFGGLYLPLEIEPSECSRSPLILAYDAAHFSALVAMSRKNEQSTDPPTVLPLLDVDRDLLAIQFEVDPGESCVWNRDELNDAVVQRIALTHEDRLALLNQFLDLVDIACPPVISTISRKQNKAKADVRNRDSAPATSPQYHNGWPVHEDHHHHHRTNSSKSLKTSVAKQFGSLSRSMGRKLRKNLIDNLTATKAAPSQAHHHQEQEQQQQQQQQWECPEFILSARLHTEKQHPCLMRMIDNYLQSARQRFEQQQSERQKQTLIWQRRKQHTLAEIALSEGPSRCINANCNMFGTAVTSYMCTACYARQLEQEQAIKMRSYKSMERRASMSDRKQQQQQLANGNALYGAGKSVFYATPGVPAVAAAAASVPKQEQDNGTLYLSNSTFFCKKESDDRKLAPKPSLKLTKEPTRLPGSLTNRPMRVQPPPTATTTVTTAQLSPQPVAPAAQMDDQSTGDLFANGSIYDTVRKPCRAAGCGAYGHLTTGGLCPDCFADRKRAATDRESILQNMRSAQLQ